MRLVLIFLSLTLASAVHAEYISPAESVPIKRYELSITVDEMKLLAGDLTKLATLVECTDTASLRTGAQIVALVKFLEPGNRDILVVEKHLQDKQNMAEPSKEIIDEAVKRSWKLHNWLMNDAAGKDTNILGACLADVLHILDKAQSNADKTEKGEWAGWVAPQSEFVKMKEMVTTTSQQVEEPAMKVETIVQLTHGKLLLPFWQITMVEDKPVSQFGLNTIQMEVTDNVNAGNLTIHLLEAQAHPGFQNKIQQTISTWFNAKYSKPPTGKSLTFSCGGEKYYDVPNNRQEVPAALIALTASAIDGQEANGVIIASVNAKQEIALPHNGWVSLRFMSDKPSAKIILPESCVALLPNLIVLDELPYFLKHDVFVAKDLAGIISLSKIKQDEITSKALADFDEIRVKANPNAIGNFVRIPAVTKRLEAIVAACPNYISAKALLLEARNSAPKVLNAEASAQEIRRAIMPLTWMRQTLLQNVNAYANLNLERFTKAHEDSRKNLDAIAKIIAPEQKDLFTDSMKLTDAVRAFARAAKNVLDENGYYEKATFHEKSAKENRVSILKLLPELEAKISELLQESSPGE